MLICPDGAERIELLIVPDFGCRYDYGILSVIALDAQRQIQRCFDTGMPAQAFALAHADRCGRAVLCARMMDNDHGTTCALCQPSQIAHDRRHVPAVFLCLSQDEAQVIDDDEPELIACDE